MERDLLIEKAARARDNAYCPYSSFPVGAAILTGSGAVYLGANVENVVNGLSMCAERVALFKAITKGEDRFRKLAVVCGEYPCPPCGACRQTLYEHAPDLEIIMADPKGNYTVRSLGELLPFPFEL